jgi:hypothetical protein
MPFAALAAVELQLIMRFCDQQSLLALARCCGSTLAAASVDFAWQCVSPVVIHASRFGPASADASASDSALRRLGQSLRCGGCCPCAPSRPPPPALPFPLEPHPRWSLLRHTDQLLRWTGGDHHFSQAHSLIRSLPRLIAIDVPDDSASFGPDSLALLREADQLTALDLSAVYLRHSDIQSLVVNAERLRTLRIRPSGDVRGCLEPLHLLPQLTDLELVDYALDKSSAADYAVIGQCRRLRRLTLIAVVEGCCGPILLAPGLQRLRDLTLAHTFRNTPQPLTDWAAACANLHSLRRLTLLRSDTVCIGAILAAVTAGCCPRLRLLRLAPHILDANCWKDAISACEVSGKISLVAAISLLLESRPEVRIELRVGFHRAAVSASWLLPLRAECHWLTATPEWTSFDLLSSQRRPAVVPTLLFADSEMHRAAPLDSDSDED